MSMLSGIFGSISQNNVSSYGPTESEPASGSVDLSKMKPGQTVTGKIVGVSHDTVSVDLGKGNVLQAKLEGAMDLQPGQTVTFSLKGNQGAQVTLTPLYTNMDHVATAAKALTAANMPVNSSTLSMTTAMMDAGMGIDKQSLGEMYQKVSANPQADAGTLVEMKKIGLDITPKNISQFQAYQNYENQISDGMKQIIQDVQDLFRELNSAGQTKEATTFMDSVLRIFTENPNGESVVLPEGQALNRKVNENGELVSGVAQEPANANPEAPGTADLNHAATFRDKIAETTAKEVFNLVAEGKEGEVTEGKILSETKPAEAQTTQEGMPLKQNENIESGKTGFLTEGMQKELLSLVKNMDSEGATVTLPETQNMLPKDALVLARQLLAQHGMTPALKEFLEGKEFQSLLKEEIQNQWMLSPKQVEKKQTVETLFDRLQKQTQDLTKVLTSIAKPESALSNHLSSMNQNLDFMNQMNQMYQYVQLPLKMNGSETTGDLFVYTDKKNLAQKDGNVSALLHLDMPHLGALDVYASITPSQSVFTKFYLESDDMITFIEQNISILTERLNQKGYQVQSEMLKRGDEEKISPQLFAKEQGVIPTTVGHFSFDMRA